MHQFTITHYCFKNTFYKT